MAWHPTRSPDIMECKDENGGCDQICIDFPGGYSCSCRAGFTQLASDRSSCSGMGTDMIVLRVYSNIFVWVGALWVQTLMSVEKEAMTAVRSVSTLLDHTTATVSVAFS